MTLQERLMSEFDKKFEGTYMEDMYRDEVDGEVQMVQLGTEVKRFILHTIEQTIKEGEKVIETLREEHNIPCQPDEVLDYEQALTDTQHALRGIIK